MIMVVMDVKAAREALVFGGVDGAVVSLGLVAGLAVAHQAHGAVWHSALSGGLAELAGMTAGKRQSDNSPWLVSASCGAASLVSAAIPGIPWLFGGGWVVLVISLGLVAAIGSLIAMASPVKGWRAHAQVHGLLLAAAGLTVLGGLT